MIEKEKALHNTCEEVHSLIRHLSSSLSNSVLPKQASWFLLDLFLCRYSPLKTWLSFIPDHPIFGLLFICCNSGVVPIVLSLVSSLGTSIVLLQHLLFITTCSSSFCCVLLLSHALLSCSSPALVRVK